MTGFELNHCCVCGRQLSPDDFDGICSECDATYDETLGAEGGAPMTTPQTKADDVMTEERLKEIEARAAKASPAPWSRVKRLGALDWTPGVIRNHTASPLPMDNFDADWEFIENARADIPLLLAEIRRLQSERDALRAVVEKLPMTRDGVRVVPGVDPVWSELHGGIYQLDVECSGGLFHGSFCGEYFRPMSECYSKRELAAAALAPAAPNGGGVE